MSKLVEYKFILKAPFLLKSVSGTLMKQIMDFSILFSQFLIRPFVRVWYNCLKLHNSDYGCIFFSRSPSGPLRDVFSKMLILPWLLGISQHPLQTPIFEAELCVAVSGIFHHVLYTNYFGLAVDN